MSRIPFNPRELDVFFTSGRDPVSCIFNRGFAAGKGILRAFDFDIETHVGFMTPDCGQWMATELTPTGIEEDSFEKYFTQTRFKARLHSVYRWRGFDSPGVRSRVLAHLAQLRQQNRPYDYPGAILTSKLARKLFPWLREKQGSEYCSENVTRILVEWGWKNYPQEWRKSEPHPHPLRLAIARDSFFTRIF